MRNGYRAWLDGPIREAATVDVNGGRVVRHLGPAVPHGDHGRHPRWRQPHPHPRRQHRDEPHGGRVAPNYRLLNLRYGERFVPQDMDQVKVLPSGLTAPVRLILGH